MVYALATYRNLLVLLVNVILIMSQDFSTSLMSLPIYPLSHQNESCVFYHHHLHHIQKFSEVCMRVHDRHILSRMTRRLLLFNL